MTLLAVWMGAKLRGGGTMFSLLLPQHQFCPEPFPDTLFETSQTATDPSCHYFSMNYEEARNRFRQACEKAEAELVSLSIPDRKTAPDESLQEGPSLTIDIGILHGDLPGLVVHTSGVHGIEGYIGSAVQLAYLEEKNLPTLPSKRPTIVLVHAVNPFGMKYYRRTNENNVDLNRNALSSQEWEIYASSNHFNKKTYDFFSSFFNPPKPPTELLSEIEFWLSGTSKLLLYGLSTLRAAMVGGQFHEPKGIFYGGDKLEDSIVQLYEWFSTFLNSGSQSENDNSHDSALLSRNFRKVTWIDVHTGLGEFGVDTLLTREHTELLPDRDISAELQRWFSESLSPFSGDSTKAQKVSEGYEKVRGFVPDYMESLFAREQDPLLLIQEIGTIPSILVGKALILENMAYHYLPKEEAIKWAKRTTLPAFYPQSSLWRERALQNGLRVLHNAVERSSQF